MQQMKRTLQKSPQRQWYRVSSPQEAGGIRQVSQVLWTCVKGWEDCAQHQVGELAERPALSASPVGSLSKGLVQEDGALSLPSTLTGSFPHRHRQGFLKSNSGLRECSHTVLSGQQTAWQGVAVPTAHQS